MRLLVCDSLYILSFFCALAIVGPGPGKGSVTASPFTVEMEPRILPVRMEYSVVDGDVVIDQGTNLVLSCQAIKATVWKLPSFRKIFGDQFLASDLELSQEAKIENGTVVNPLDGYAHFSILTLFNVTYLHTGYFTCHHDDASEEDVDASARLYVFVSGKNHREWMALPGSQNETLHLSIKSRKNTVIPCRPTHPTVEILLLDSKEEVIPEEGRWSFDLHQGFQLVTLPQQRLATYYCQVQSWHYQASRRNVFTRVIRLNISEPAFVNLKPLNQTETDVVDGGDVLWLVEIDAFPGAQISWYDSEGSRIEGSSLKRKVSTEENGLTSLELNAVERFHTGQYRLEVTTEDRRKSLTFSLRVKYLPKVRIPLEVVFEKYVAQYYNIGETFAFEWAVDAYPPPEIIIYFGECHTYEFVDDDVQCRSSWTLSQSLQAGTKQLRTDGNRETVTVSEKRFWFGDGRSVSVTGEARLAGEYLCRACNELGCSKHTFNTRKLQIFEVHNGFEFSGLTQDPYVEDQVTLTCGISLYTYRKGITWTWTTPEGATVTLGPKNSPPGSRLQIGNNYQTSYVEMLHWSHIPFNAGGIYSCRTLSLQNSSEEKTMEFQVLGNWAPVIIFDPNEPNTTWVPQGQPFQLSCLFHGGPVPTIQWTKDGNVTFNATITTTGNTSVLNFVSIQYEDAGVYRCTATNRIGTTHHNFALGVGLAPGIIAAIVIGTILVFSLSVAVLVRTTLRAQKRRNFARSHQLDTFHSGDPDGIDPDLQVFEQTHLLPFNSRWEFPRKRLTLVKTLSEGSYGLVLKGEAEKIRKFEAMTVVTVKMAKSRTDLAPLRNLMSELKILIHVGSHVNLTNLLGACTERVTRGTWVGERENLIARCQGVLIMAGELIVIYEHCCHGNVRDYIIRNRERFVNHVSWAGKYNPNPKKTEAASTTGTEEGSVCSASSASSDPSNPWPSNHPVETDDESTEPFRTQELICWAFQIARGMRFLASRKVVHGDLAARNVLLGADNVVKIADFGLAKNVYRSVDLLQEIKKGTIPVRWMAAETLRHGTFSLQSDVWSFGIFLWELFSLAKMPYAGVDFDDAFIRKLNNGYRMEKPRYSPNSIYNLMGSCWRLDPTKRPNFVDLEDFLGHLLDAAVRQRYLDLNEPYVKTNAKLLNQTPDYLNMMADINYVPKPGDESELFVPPD